MPYLHIPTAQTALHNTPHIPRTVMAKAKTAEEQAELEEALDAEEDESSEDTTRLKIKTKLKKDALGEERVFEGAYEMPATVEGCVSEYGQEMVYSFIKAALRSRVKSAIRPALAEGKTVGPEGNQTTERYSDEEVQAVINDYSPSLTSGRTAKSDSEKVLSAANNINNPEELAALIAQLQAKAESFG